MYWKSIREKQLRAERILNTLYVVCTITITITIILYVYCVCVSMCVFVIYKIPTF